MKKLALIMLAVVSMALVSCGGGGLKPAENAFLYAEYGDCCGEIISKVVEAGEFDEKLQTNVYRPYKTEYYREVDDKGSNDCLKDCLKITQAAVSQTGLEQLTVTVDFEVVKDMVLPKCEIDFEPCATFELLDKNSVTLEKKRGVTLPEGKKGDVKSLSIDIKTGSPKEILKNAKYVRFNNVHVSSTYSDRKLIREEKIN